MTTTTRRSDLVDAVIAFTVGAIIFYGCTAPQQRQPCGPDTPCVQASTR